MQRLPRCDSPPETHARARSGEQHLEPAIPQQRDEVPNVALEPLPKDIHTLKPINNNDHLLRAKRNNVANKATNSFHLSKVPSSLANRSKRRSISASTTTRGLSSPII